MSSFNRRSFFILLAGLPACGFTPVYGPSGSAEGLRGDIEIDDPRDERGFSLVRALENRLGLPDNPRYRLSAQIFTGIDEIGITPEQETTRYNVKGEVAFTLTDTTTGRSVTSGRVASFTSYSATGTPVSTQSASRDAYDRLMVVLADQIVARLLATASDWRA
jgi:LPS-assembly lipoprotein